MEPRLPFSSGDALKRHTDPWRSAAIDGARALALIVLAAVLLRLILLPLHAYQPDGGGDEDFWMQWMEGISHHGILNAFSNTNANYTGYLWILAGLAAIFDWLGGSYSSSSFGLHALVKAPPIAFDLLLIVWAYLAVFAVASESGDGAYDAWARRRTRRIALLAAAIVAVHPVVLYDSAVWSQTDSGVSVAMLAAIILCVRGRTGWGGVVWALAFLIKPQAIVVAPLLAFIVLRRRSVPDAVRAAVGIGVTAAVVLGPWFMHGAGGDVLRVYRSNFKEHLPVLSPSAWNLWWIHDAARGHSETDAKVIGGLPLTYRQIGSALTLAAVVLSLWYATVRPTLRGALIAAAYAVVAFYILPVGTRERYAYPALVLLLPVVTLSGQFRWALLALSATVIMNMIARAPPVFAWHGNGMMESPLGIAMSVVNVLIFCAFTIALVRDARLVADEADAADQDSRLDAVPRPVASTRV